MIKMSHPFLMKTVCLHTRGKLTFLSIAIILWWIHWLVCLPADLKSQLWLQWLLWLRRQVFCTNLLSSQRPFHSANATTWSALIFSHWMLTASHASFDALWEGLIGHAWPIAVRVCGVRRWKVRKQCVVIQQLSSNKVTGLAHSILHQFLWC